MRVLDAAGTQRPPMTRTVCWRSNWAIIAHSQGSMENIDKLPDKVRSHGRITDTLSALKSGYSIPEQARVAFTPRSAGTRPLRVTRSLPRMLSSPDIRGAHVLGTCGSIPGRLATNPEKPSFDDTLRTCPPSSPGARLASDWGRPACWTPLGPSGAFRRLNHGVAV